MLTFAEHPGWRRGAPYLLPWPPNWTNTGLGVSVKDIGGLCIARLKLPCCRADAFRIFEPPVTSGQAIRDVLGLHWRHCGCADTAELERRYAVGGYHAARAAFKAWQERT